MITGEKNLLLVIVLSLSALVAPTAAGHDFFTGNGDSPDGPDDPNDQDDPCGGEGADPVTLFSGDLLLDRTDARIPGRGIDVDLAFRYRSRSAYNGPFGYGWELVIHRRLNQLANGDVAIQTGTNRVETFTFNGSGFDNPEGFSGSLTANANGTFTLRARSGFTQTFDVNGNLARMEDTSGNGVDFTYTAQKLPILGPSPYFVDQPTGVISMEYLLLQITDTVGRQIDFAYDGQNRLESISYAGRQVRYTYSPAGDLVSVRAPATAEYPAGTTTTYGYDGTHNLTSVTDARGQTILTNTYDSSDRVDVQVAGDGTYDFTYGTDGGNPTTTVVDPAGVVTTYTFDAGGLMTKKEVFTDGVPAGEPASYVTTYVYGAQDRLIREVWPRGNAVEYQYTTDGDLLEVRRKAVGVAAFTPHPSDLVTGFSYEPLFGKPKSVIDPKGRVTVYTYDYEMSEPARGLVRKIAFPTVAGNPVEMTQTYNAFGQVETATDPNGNVVRRTYDASNGHPTSITAGFGTPKAATVQLVHDAVGNLVAYTDANGNTTQVEVNALDQITTITSPAPLSYEVHYRYDEVGNLAQVDRQLAAANPGPLPAFGASSPTDGWQTTRYVASILNQIGTMTDDRGQVVTYDYDALGRQTSFQDELGRVTAFEYEERGLLARTIDSNATPGVTEYRYDENGNHAVSTDAATNTTTFTYDGHDRRTRTTHPDGTFEELTYDEASNVTLLRTTAGQMIAYQYDALNRITSKATASETTTFSYDAGSRLLTASDADATLQFAYDPLDRIIAATTTISGLTSRTVEYGFDPAGNRARIKYPNGDDAKYTYDALNRPLTISASPVIQRPLAEFTYDALDRRTSRVLENDVRTDYRYDALGRVERMVHRDPTAVLDQVHYGYDPTGNRTSLIDPAGSHAFAYDPEGQIVDASHPAGFDFASSTYTYDTRGNRTATTGGAGNATYVTNALNQYSSVGGVAFSYDADGNLTNDGSTTYAYDEEGRILSASGSFGTITYGYDPLGRRVRATENGVATYFLYDATDLIHELDASGQVDATYVHGPGLDEPLTMDRAGQRHYYLADALGSVRALVDAAATIVERYAYDAFGNVGIHAPNGTPLPDSAFGNRFLFSGREWDPNTGLVHLRMRDYSPAIGRFLQRDPIGFLAETNVYRYVGNNPLNWLDPFGMSKGVGQPGFWEGFIPVWGSGRAAVDDFQNGRWGWGLWNSFLAVTDVIPVRAVAGAAGKGLWRLGSRYLSRGTRTRVLGRAGEASAGIWNSSKTSIQSISGTAARRFPDGLNGTTITEVKNVRELGRRYWNQINDDLLHAQRNGLDFDLWVRKGTDITDPRIQQAINNGSINLKYLDDFSSRNWADNAFSGAGDLMNGTRDPAEPDCDD